jgi:alpha-mannosidase
LASVLAAYFVQRTWSTLSSTKAGEQIVFNNVKFNLAPAKTGVLNAIVAKEQTINLPAGSYNRVYVLAGSANGDQKALFKVGNTGST